MYRPISKLNGGGSRGDCLLHEEYEYDADRCPIALASVEVFDHAVRVLMCSRPMRQTLQNSFDQKGVAHFADLSDLVTDRGELIDVISSMYSFVGRAACGQVLEQRAEGLPCILDPAAAGYGYFFVSSDSAHNHLIYHTKHGANPMRMCRLTYEALLKIVRPVLPTSRTATSSPASPTHTPDYHARWTTRYVATACTVAPCTSICSAHWRCVAECTT